MSDIVERLRNHFISQHHGGCADCYGSVMDDAADEIERLRAALKIIAGSSDWVISRQAAAALDNIGPDVDHEG